MLRLWTLVAGFLAVAWAWDKDGHEAIGMTTMSALDTTAVAQVKHLTGGKDAADVAAWAHKVNKKYPWTTELHFQRQPSERCEKANFTNCADNRCMVKGILYFYGRLTGKDLVELKWPDGVKLTDADCVKYLINLMGDMAQPMHFGTGETDMGRNITVLFRGKTTNLYDVWDKELTQAVIKDSPGFWWGGWTHVQRTRVEYEKDSEQFKQEHEMLLKRWADESAKFMCESVYRNPVTGKQILDELDSKGVFRISDELFEAWKREMLSKMLVAGARTAVVLNSILHHREGQLKAGTAVSHLEGEEEEEEYAKGPAPKGRRADLPRTRHLQGPAALMVNLLIGSISLFCFLVLMRLWSGPDRVRQAEREKRAASGKKF
mmetsp:Transcript_51937/g.121773  ORF Transcript_51937/g.121773 Transcript_51937/m.121773 type:complete len:376 (-) Transcript_51937:68-1195(-)